MHASARTAPAEAQQARRVTVTGTVIDESGAPVVGAGILVKDDVHTGTVTDERGRFSISVPQGTVLVVSSLGYKDTEIVAGQSPARIVLSEDMNVLDELVVIGYGVQKRSDLTGAVSSVGNEEFKDLAVNDISQALAGRIAGLDITSSTNSRDPGSAGSILLRGHRSFKASNDPLIILDGMTFYGGINDINPNDIESIDVLKDASSTAIYGSRGANGVIVITSMAGKTGAPTLTYNGQVTLTTPHRQPWSNASQWIDRTMESLRAGGIAEADIEKATISKIGQQEWDYYKSGGDTDWQSLFFQNGFAHRHQVNVSGGTDRVTYNVSANLLNDEGIIPSRQFDRYTLRPTLDIKVTRNFKVGVSTMLSYGNRHSHVSSNAFRDARMAPPTAVPYDEAGNIKGIISNTSTWYKNPLLEIETDAYKSENRTLSAYTNLYADWNILPSLNYRFTYGLQLSSTAGREAAKSMSNALHGDSGDMTSLSDSNNRLNSFENVLTFNKKFADKHTLTLTGIHSYQYSYWDTNYNRVEGMPYFPALWNNIGTATKVSSYSSNMNEWKLLSFAGRLFYNYDDRYILTASTRVDGASQFADGHKWGVFPSAALAWRISNESFMKNIDWISNLKLRLSYGVSGNQGISPYQTQGSLSSTKYSFDGADGLGMRPGELANANLSWEKTTVYNIGLDFGFLKDRISGSVELYRSETNALLMDRQLPITTGFSQVLANVGSTQNSGIELTLQTHNVETKDFSWRTNLSFYLNREKITELYNGKNDDVGSNWFIGYPIQVYYDFEKIGIWQSDEAAEAAKFSRNVGDIKVADNNHNGIVDDGDRKIIGSKQPLFVANLVNNLRYRNWNLSFELYSRWGHMINADALWFDSHNNTNLFLVDYWTPNNPTNAFPRPNDKMVSIFQSSTMQRLLGSFIRLKNVSLGYTFKCDWMDKVGLGSLRFYLTGENLCEWSPIGLHKYQFDLESGTDYPWVSAFTFGVDVKFSYK